MSRERVIIRNPAPTKPDVPQLLRLLYFAPPCSDCEHSDLARVMSTRLRASKNSSLGCMEEKLSDILRSFLSAMRYKSTPLAIEPTLVGSLLIKSDVTSSSNKSLYWLLEEAILVILFREPHIQGSSLILLLNKLKLNTSAVQAEVLRSVNTFWGVPTLFCALRRTSYLDGEQILNILQLLRFFSNCARQSKSVKTAHRSLGPHRLPSSSICFLIENSRKIVGPNLTKIQASLFAEITRKSRGAAKLLQPLDPLLGSLKNTINLHRVAFHADLLNTLHSILSKCTLVHHTLHALARSHVNGGSLPEFMLNTIDFLACLPPHHHPLQRHLTFMNLLSSIKFCIQDLPCKLARDAVCQWKSSSVASCSLNNMNHSYVQCCDVMCMTILQKFGNDKDFVEKVSRGKMLRIHSVLADYRCLQRFAIIHRYTIH